MFFSSLGSAIIVSPIKKNSANDMISDTTFNVVATGCWMPVAGDKKIKTGPARFEFAVSFFLETLAAYGFH